MKPGSLLSAQLRSLGFAPCQGCEAVAREMDSLGVQGCKENFENLIQKILENKKAQNLHILDAVVRAYVWQFLNLLS